MIEQPRALSTEAAMHLDTAERAANPERGQARALTGIGWAILDLAAAIREGNSDE